MAEKMLTRLNALDERLGRYSLPLGELLALLLSGALAVYNVSSGPLHNLNDIGTWSSRALFIAMTACVHAAVLLLCAWLYRGRFSRLALRQMILTAGMYIMLIAINQKTYAYVKGIQPLVRAMDTQGLAAMAGYETNLSAPAMTLLYLVTRGPVYDMYLVKLLCIGCVLALSVLAAWAADRAGFGLRTEALMTLCAILPQAFMNAACSAQMETAGVCLLGISLALMYAARPRPMAALLCYGAACALCGACLYALPVYGVCLCSGKVKGKHFGAAALVLLTLCLPAVFAGVPAGEVLSSLLRANLGTPAYASGAPNVMSFIARPVMEQTPEYASMLRHLPELDALANAQQDYTPDHYVWIARGFTLAALAMYMGVAALLLKKRDGDTLRSAMALALAGLLACPGVSSGAWLALDLMCLWAIVSRRDLRLPACMALFATAGASCYPMTEETMLPMAAAAGLCLLALCCLLGVFDVHGEEDAQG